MAFKFIGNGLAFQSWRRAHGGLAKPNSAGWLGNCCMKESEWTYICSSVIGSRHLEAGLPCQDASDCKFVRLTDDSEVLIAVASDGAGSAQYAQAGSATACARFVSDVRASLDKYASISFLTADYLKEWIAAFQHEIKVIAEQNETSPREYACSFAAAIIADEQGAIAQIGDGRIVILEAETNHSYQTVFWPQQGEFANQTNFLTDAKTEANLMFTTIYRNIEEIAVFTNRMQSLVLDEKNQTAHNPFF